MPQPQRNPFRTRQIRPGAIRYLFNQEESCSSLAEHLQQHGWRGQIIGPHGSGKSTLLASLVPACVELGRQVQQFTLRDRERRLPFSRQDYRQWTSSTLIVIDGYEQLGWLSRCRLRLLAYRKNCGLLVTTHRRVFLPVLFRTTASIELTQKIVQEIVPTGSQIQEDDVTRAFKSCDGNVREVLFALYDVYRKRHPS